MQLHDDEAGAAMTVAKKERPILFSGPMVRAILEERKTQTRRVVKGRVALEWLAPGMFSPEFVANSKNHLCPYGQPGDRLWVRETWGLFDTQPADGAEGARVFYRASETDPKFLAHQLWRPSIYMPRWASRLTLEVTGVRVERLQEISEAEAMAEGLEAVPPQRWWQGYRDLGDRLLHQEFAGGAPPEWMIEPKPLPVCGNEILYPTAARQYRDLWNSINAKRGFAWELNPWVWVVEFKAVQP